MRNRGVFSYLFGELLAIGLSLALVLILAGVVWLSPISANAVKIIIQIAKLAAIVIGCSVCIREKGGILKGGCFGLIYAFLTFVMFSWFTGGFDFGKSFLFDMLFGLIAGAISGILSVNLSNK